MRDSWLPCTERSRGVANSYQARSGCFWHEIAGASKSSEQSWPSGGGHWTTLRAVFVVAASELVDVLLGPDMTGKFQDLL